MGERIEILPGNPRTQPGQLISVFGYDNLYSRLAEVEIATMQVLGEIGVIPADEIALLTPQIIDDLKAIPTTLVDKTEREITKHDIRAWVLEAQKVINSRLGRWVHIPLTSYDPLSTGRMLQYLWAYQNVLKPSIQEIIVLMADMVERFAGQVQIGRSHGQHGLPITVGFWLATVLSRILFNAEKMDEFSQQLVGKISGAMGAHNAQIGLGFDKLCGDMTFEEKVLNKLGIKPARISTQILPPEPLAYFLYSCAMQCAAFAQFGRDGRQLMRTEIAEFSEPFGKTQVGSSAMPHKRNPIVFEGTEGEYTKTIGEFVKVLLCMISEHQRDLVGSRPERDFPIILVNLQSQMNGLTRKDDEGIAFLSRLVVNREACERNFEQSAKVILAEPINIALLMGGYKGDAHSLLNHELVPVALAQDRMLIDVLEEAAASNEEISKALANIPKDVKDLFRNPKLYVGDAETKARQIAQLAREWAA